MASTDQSPASGGGVSAVGRRLNPAAPVFLPRVTINNHFYWLRQYCSPPPPPPPPYYAAVSPTPYIPLYQNQHGNNYYQNPNPRPYATVTPPPPPPLHTSTATEPDPSFRQGFVCRKSGLRVNSGGCGRGRGRGHLGNMTPRRAWRKKTADVVVESDGCDITTVMIRNIPNKYTRALMIEFLDKFCQEINEKEKEELQKCSPNEAKEKELVFSAYDFLYLPIDFRSGMNKGYAFVNFTESKSVRKFMKACNHKPWDLFNSKKRLEVASARIQGKDKLVRHFERMIYPLEDYTAVYFVPPRGGPSDDGSSSSQTVMVGQCIGPVR